MKHFDLPQAIEFGQSRIGSVGYATWADSLKLRSKLHTELQSLASDLSLSKKFYFLNIHYFGPHLSKESEVEKRMRIFIDAVDAYKEILGEYEPIIEEYDLDETHFCSRMIKEDLAQEYWLRICLDESAAPVPAGCIKIPKVVFDCLMGIPPNTGPDDFLKEYQKHATPATKAGIAKIEKVCDFCNKRRNCTKLSTLPKELFGTLNATLRVKQKNKLKFSAYIDILLLPISVRCDSKDDVIAVIVGVRRPSPSFDVDPLRKVFTSIVHAIHHRNFQFLKMRLQTQTKNARQRKLHGILDAIDETFKRKKAEERKKLDSSEPAVMQEGYTEIAREEKKFTMWMAKHRKEVDAAKEPAEFESIESKLLKRQQEEERV
jgi:hypothetical protein